MKRLREHASGIILCLAELLIGVLLLLDPVAFTSNSMVLVGIALMSLGLLDTIRYFRVEPAEAAVSQQLARGLAALLAGAFCTFNTQWFLDTFPVITVLYGVIMLLAALGKVQFTVDLCRLRNPKWFWGAITAAVSLLCAIVIIQNPFPTADALWLFTGIALLAEAVLDAAAMLLSYRAAGAPAA